MRRALCQALLIILLALPGPIIRARVTPVSFAPPADTMPQKAAEGEILLKDALALSHDSTVLWIDARTDDAYRTEHIPGAILLSEDNWDEALPGFFEAWKPGSVIIVYCNSTSCHRSRHVAQRLKEEAGIPNVFVLAGGWNAWKQR